MTSWQPAVRCAVPEPAWSWTPPTKETYGDLAAGVGEDLGLPPDAEQRMILDAIHAENEPGVPTSFEVAVVAPRQNLKTATLEIAALTDLFVFREPRHMWTAHLFKTSQSTFQHMVGLIEAKDEYRKLCRKPRTANGDEAIELLTGERIEFHARSKGGGRGMSGNKITVDEALFLSAQEVAALFPVLATRPSAQIRYGSSAGLVTSEVLRRIRDRGRAGNENRLSYFEWAAPYVDCANPSCTHRYGEVEGCALDRWDLLAMSNPALDRRIRRDTMQSFRQAMDPLEFAREFLGWWDEPGGLDAAFGRGKWEACLGAPPPPGLPLGAIGIAASMDGLSGAVVGAAADGDQIHIKPLQHGPGTGWLPSRVAELQRQHGCPVVLDDRGPASVLIPALELAGVKVTKLGTRDVLDACAGILDLVRERKLHHAGYAELDLSVGGAAKRMVGDRWAWGRKDSTSDISTLEAGTLAVHVVSLPKKSAPARPVDLGTTRPVERGSILATSF